MSYTDVITEELTTSFLTGGRRNDYRETKVDEAVRLLDAGMQRRDSFISNWVELFAIFSEQESLRAMQRIYKRVGLPIPTRLKQLENLS